METQFFNFFEVTRGNKRYKEYLHLRHDVFVEELHCINPQEASQAQHIETDMFDPYSRHLIAEHKSSGETAACARLILPNPNGLNTEARYSIEEHPFPDQNRENTGEISRMAISLDFRRRKEDDSTLISGDPNREIGEPEKKNKAKAKKGRNHQPELVLGMYREIYYLAQKEGIHYCIAAMDKRFSRLLIRIGYPFRQIGPENKNLVPVRQPFIISQAEMEKKLDQLHPDVLKFMQCKNS